MALLSRIIQRVSRDFFKWRYLQAARHVLSTGPQSRGTMAFLLLSMVHKRDVISYLVAVKSFAQHANPQRIVVVCDASIDDGDRAIFRLHVPHIELRDASEFADNRAPRGGCWERLLAITTYVGDNFVVQLDADTVTTHPIPEVVDSISSGTGFVLGEKPQQRALSLADTSDYARRSFAPYTHIQAVAELKMVELDRPKEDLYIRGCAGFTGFPRTADMREKLFAYSAQMEKLIGERWSTWGTEQVTSNFLVANAHGTKVLPFPKYCTPDEATNETAFLHFIGYTRFVNTQYEKTSQRIIRGLRSNVDSK